MEEMDLRPKTCQAVFEGDGGAYYTWSTSQMSLLAKTNVGAGLLVLHPSGFALPHYADSSKLGFVLQGSDGVVGLVLPNTRKEVVLKLQKGDVIPVPIGGVSWWFNNGDSDLKIAFLGETSQAHIPGQFTYFFLTGTLGLLGGFSTELLSKVYNLTTNDTNKLTKSQTGVLIIKLQEGQKMPSPQMDKTKELVYNIDSAQPDNDVENVGLVATLTEAKFPFVGEVGLSAVRVRLEPNALKAPAYLPTPAVQLIYIGYGGGKIEIVGMNGKSVLNTQVKAGELLLVPKFFVIAVIAGEEGIEYFSILTTRKPIFEELAGKASIWEAMSPALLEVALSVDAISEKLFLSNMEYTTNLIPPSD